MFNDGGMFKYCPCEYNDILRANDGVLRYKIEVYM